MHSLGQAIWGDLWKSTMGKSRTTATCVTLHPLGHAIWGHIWKTYWRKVKKKCNECDLASFQANILTRHLNRYSVKIHSWEKSNNQCLLPGKRFEETFKDAQWRKVKQMQPMRLCLFSSRQFEATFENAQWRKVKQMQPMRLCLLSGKRFDLSTHLKTHWRKVNKMQPMWLCFQADNLKKHSGGFLQPSQSLHTCPSVKCTNTTMQVYYNHLRPAILGGT